MEAKSQRLNLDIISTLPQTIIETILCLLPIEEAARTSILSKEWRYKWTKIPKIEFWAYDLATISRTTFGLNQPCVKTSSRQNTDQRCKLFYVIHQVLLLRQAPIHEFILYINTNCHCLELDQVILHLSMNHIVKKLTLVLNESRRYKLPSCFFSLHHLTDLDLEICDLDHQPKCTGFAFCSLRSLLLKNPLEFKDLGDEDCTFVELFECLPALEHLTIRPYILSYLVLDSIPKELPTLLIHLKYFCFEEMSFAYDDELTFVANLIKCSPNLEKIRLEIIYNTENDDGFCFSFWEKYSDVWLEHLTELEFQHFRNFKSEMEFVKFILARSPNLKKMRITSAVVKDQEQLEMLKVLLRAPRASSVEIVVV